VSESVRPTSRGAEDALEAMYQALAQELDDVVASGERILTEMDTIDGLRGATTTRSEVVRSAGDVRRRALRCRAEAIERRRVARAGTARATALAGSLEARIEQASRIVGRRRVALVANERDAAGGEG
jgi:hypothetical protein